MKGLEAHVERYRNSRLLALWPWWFPPGFRVVGLGSRVYDSLFLRGCVVVVADWKENGTFFY